MWRLSLVCRSWLRTAGPLHDRSLTEWAAHFALHERARRMVDFGVLPFDIHQGRLDLRVLLTDSRLANEAELIESAFAHVCAEGRRLKLDGFRSTDVDSMGRLERAPAGTCMKVCKRIEWFAKQQAKRFEPSTAYGQQFGGDRELYLERELRLAMLSEILLFRMGTYNSDNAWVVVEQVAPLSELERRALELYVTMIHEADEHRRPHKTLLGEPYMSFAELAREIGGR